MEYVEVHVGSENLLISYAMTVNNKFAIRIFVEFYTRIDEKTKSRRFVLAIFTERLLIDSSVKLKIRISLL